MSFRGWVILVANGLGFLGALTGWGSEPDKSQYNLFNPVPREAMRPLITDRPSLTEGPYTVDAGHFQVESDIGTWTHDTDASGVVSEMTKLASVNLKTGLLPSLDLHTRQLCANSHRGPRGGDFRSSIRFGRSDRTLEEKLLGQRFWILCFRGNPLLQGAHRGAGYWQRVRGGWIAISLGREASGRI